jgi:ubiquinone/menaquinone biosynthesis C-methylase UbiE
VSSYVFMKLLETSADRYDRGMGLLSLGRIGSLYAAVARRVPEGARVLEVGCGTGGVTAHLLARGCRVTGVDRSARMLAVARGKLAGALDSGQLELRTLNLIQLDHAFTDGEFDAAVCCLVLSELSAPERRFALTELCRIVRPGGVVVLADEVAPRSRLRRIGYRVVRAPMVALTYALTQTSTRHTGDLAAVLAGHGLDAVETETPHGESFQIAWGRKPAWRLQPQP